MLYTVVIAMNIADFTIDIIDKIIGSDYEVYRGMLTLSWFARVQTPYTIIDWAIRCGVDVHVTRTHIKWTLNGRLHRAGDLPALTIKNKYGTTEKWSYANKYHRRDNYTERTQYYAPKTIQMSWRKAMGSPSYSYNSPSSIFCKCDDDWNVIVKQTYYSTPSNSLTFDEFHDAIGDPLHIRPADNTAMNMSTRTKIIVVDMTLQ